MRTGSRQRPNLKVTNRSGYDTEDLRAFFARGLRAMNVTGFRHVLVVAAPRRTRGCADVGAKTEGRVIVIAVAPPSGFDLRRLARVFVHEVAHTRGYEHEAMPHDLLFSLGGTPRWARGARIRYRGRAPNQFDYGYERYGSRGGRAR